MFVVQKFVFKHSMVVVYKACGHLTNTLYIPDVQT